MDGDWPQFKTAQIQVRFFSCSSYRSNDSACTAKASQLSAAIKKSIRVAQSGWYHLRAEGRPADRFPLDSEYAQAFTNPVWVKVGTLPIRNRESAEYGIRWVDKLQQIAVGMALWRSEAEKKHTLAIFDEARQVYRRLAGEATVSSASRP